MRLRVHVIEDLHQSSGGGIGGAEVQTNIMIDCRIIKRSIRLRGRKVRHISVNVAALVCVCVESTVKVTEY